MAWHGMTWHGVLAPIGSLTPCLEGLQTAPSDRTIRQHALSDSMPADSTHLGYRPQSRAEQLVLLWMPVRMLVLLWMPVRMQVGKGQCLVMPHPGGLVLRPVRSAGAVPCPLPGVAC